MDDAGLDAELAAYVVVNLHWEGAIEETRDCLGAEVSHRTPGDRLLNWEFLRVNGAVRRELGFAQKATLYACGEPLFNPLFNDGELYTFIGSLYLARHFAVGVNRSAFLRSNPEFTKKQLLMLVCRCNINDAKALLSPELAQLTNKVLETKYITHRPEKYTLEKEHLSPVLQALRERQRVLAAETDEKLVHHARVVVKHFQQMEEEIVRLYKIGLRGPRRHLSEFEPCRAEQAFALTKEQAERLLGAARVNGFFLDLITSKPPEASSISHEQALSECAEHARLWLFNSCLQVYYNFSFTYDDIGKAALSGEELEAWSSPVGYRVRLPSFEEKQLRHEALACHWDELEYPQELRDGDLLKVPSYIMPRLEAHDLPEKLEALNAFVKRQTEKKQMENVVGAEEIVSAQQPVTVTASKKRERADASASAAGAEEPSPRNNKQKLKRWKSVFDGAAAEMNGGCLKGAWHRPESSFEKAMNNKSPGLNTHLIFQYD